VGPDRLGFGYIAFAFSIFIARQTEVRRMQEMPVQWSSRVLRPASPLNKRKLNLLLSHRPESELFPKNTTNCPKDTSPDAVENTYLSVGRKTACSTVEESQSPWKELNS